MRRSCEPLDIQRLAFPGDLYFVLVNPVFEAPTAEMRAALPKEVAMASAIHNCAMGGSLVRRSLPLQQVPCHMHFCKFLCVTWMRQGMNMALEWYLLVRWFGILQLY